MEKKYWDVLVLECDKYNREIILAHLADLSCGIHDEEIKSSVYFENASKDNVENIINGIYPLKIFKWKKVENKDWNENWRPFFKNLNIDNKVKIVPSWSETKKNENEILIKIDPGMAFGTGHHETTYMMIQAMLETLNNKMSVVDVGAGSGILSILALMLGAKKVDSIENDEDAKDNFYKNMALNNLNNDLMIMDCFKLEKFDYDLILANINFKVLTRLIPKFKSCKGKLILSGLLKTDINHIEKIIFENDFKIEKKIERGEWTCLIVQKV